MSAITKIETQINSLDRVSIFINNSFCCGMTKSEFSSLHLKIHSEISCAELLKRYETLKNERVPEAYENSEQNAAVMTRWIVNFWKRNFYFFNEGNEYLSKNEVLCNYLLHESKVILPGVPKNFWSIARKYHSDKIDVHFQSVDEDGILSAIKFLNYIGIDVSVKSPALIGERAKSEYDRFFRKTYFLLRDTLWAHSCKDIIDVFEHNKYTLVYFSTIKLGGKNIKMSNLNIDEIWSLVKYKFYFNK
jgi:hypothetical protein